MSARTKNDIGIAIAKSKYKDAMLDKEFYESELKEAIKNVELYKAKLKENALQRKVLSKVIDIKERRKILIERR